MDRAERIGLGVALVAHGALFVALSFGLLTRPDATPPRDAVSVTLTDEIGLTASSRSPAESAPAPEAPEMGAFETPPPMPELTPAPRVETAPPPATRPSPQRREPRPQARREPQRSERPAERRRGSRLAGITEGIGQNLSRSTERSSSAATITGADLSSIVAIIQRQIQPCANQQRNPGPGANEIETSLRLRFDRDGSLAARPTMVRQRGLDDQNSRYAERVADLAISAVTACSPITGLPDELYRTDSGQGWHTINFNYRLP